MCVLYRDFAQISNLLPYLFGKKLSAHEIKCFKSHFLCSHAQLRLLAVRLAFGRSTVLRTTPTWPQPDQKNTVAKHFTRDWLTTLGKTTVVLVRSPRWLHSVRRKQLMNLTSIHEEIPGKIIKISLLKIRISSWIKIFSTFHDSSKTHAPFLDTFLSPFHTIFLRATSLDESFCSKIESLCAQVRFLLLHPWIIQPVSPSRSGG